jgi:MoaA/NifB/PqqE/SkfB family radical SAM enzyme
MQSEKEIETQKREKLRKEKPLVYDKVIKIEERFKRGIPTPIIDIAYDYVCNLKCKHCTASRFKKDSERTLNPYELIHLSNQADELGLCQFCISGGEPLLFKDLEQVIFALQPDKFHLTMSTNGYLLTFDKAKQLKLWGLDKVKISLDSFNDNDHDDNRNCSGSYDKAMDAMFNAKHAGLSVVIQTVVTHQNCQSQQLIDMANFATKAGFTIDVLIARPTGRWENNFNVLINKKDSQYLRDLNQTYPVIHRDTFPSYGMDKGCGAVKACLHITQYGDVLPCVFIHIGIGNIFKEPLRDIINHGMQIKQFSDYNPRCLSGEDTNFIDSYLKKTYGQQLPIDYTKIFSI